MDSPSEATKVTVAGNIRAELARQRKSRRALADHLDISVQTLWRRLTGVHAFDLDELDAICAFLDIGYGELLGPLTERYADFAGAA